MADLNSSICISSLHASAVSLIGEEVYASTEKPNAVISALAEQKIKNTPVDRVIIYNPDAVALWIWQKYTERFAPAMIRSDIAMPMLSVMPSVTPVCFASMYTGVMPEVHGIKKYEKPVLTTETLFDRFIKAGKKAAIVSTRNDSISVIFLEREMDYFIYDTPEEVNKKALEIIDEDKYDLVVIYNGDYDSTMHKFGPESEEALAKLDKNIAFYSEMVDKIKTRLADKNVFYGFCPDHGCHEIDGECGSHGLDMEEDMNVIHFYSIKAADAEK